MLNDRIVYASAKDSTIPAEVAYIALQQGVDQVFSLGGVQAIGALTFGTETVPQVDKIFGPGNQYVTVAKQLATQYKVAIDMPAGPSEFWLWQTFLPILPLWLQICYHKPNTE